jgi:hypothetical protein
LPSYKNSRQSEGVFRFVSALFGVFLSVVLCTRGTQTKKITPNSSDFYIYSQAYIIIFKVVM